MPSGEEVQHPPHDGGDGDPADNSRLPIGFVLKNRWKIQSELGHGAFGVTYGGVDLTISDPSAPTRNVAIKVERMSSKKLVLKIEVLALKKLQMCPQVVRYYCAGRHTETSNVSVVSSPSRPPVFAFNFLVMEKLSVTVADLRRRRPGQRFSPVTTLLLGLQMLQAIEAVHDQSYIHRDIKPSNFMARMSDTGPRSFVLIDFGLARRYRAEDGTLRMMRRTAGFRGTLRYAAVHAHQEIDLSRRDDLWSLFYMTVESLTGSLPWRRLRDKERVGEIKASTAVSALLASADPHCAKALHQFHSHLSGLMYEDIPNYRFLAACLSRALNAHGASEASRFDWDGEVIPLQISVRGAPAKQPGDADGDAPPKSPGLIQSLLHKVTRNVSSANRQLSPRSPTSPGSDRSVPSEGVPLQLDLLSPVPDLPREFYPSPTTARALFPSSPENVETNPTPVVEEVNLALGASLNDRSTQSLPETSPAGSVDHRRVSYQRRQPGQSERPHRVDPTEIQPVPPPVSIIHNSSRIAAEPRQQPRTWPGRKPHLQSSASDNQASSTTSPANQLRPKNTAACNCHCSVQ